MTDVSGSMLRRVLTWMVFGAGTISVFGVGAFMPMVIATFGADFPRTLSPELPVATAKFLANADRISITLRVAAVVACFATVLITSRLKSAGSKDHVVALIGAALCYVAFMASVFFTLVFFVLPKAKSVI